MADIMSDYDQRINKAKADAGYESFQGHGGLKPPPGMTPEQEARWRQSVEGRVDELSAAKAKEDAERTKQRAKVAGQVAAETAVGFTPAGIAIDVKDLVSAISDRDALMLAMSMLAFVPGADVIKSAAKARRRLEAVPKRKLAEVIEQNPERLSQETRSVVFEGAPKPKKTETLTDVDIAEATKAAADIRAGRRVSPARTRKAEVLETEEGTRLLQEDEAFREAMAREAQEAASSPTALQRRAAKESGGPEMPPYQEYAPPPAPAKIRTEPVTQEEMARQSALLRETLAESAPVATRPFRPRPLTSEPRTLREREVLPEPVSQAVTDLAEPLPIGLSGPRRTSLVDDPVGGLVEASPSTGRSQVKTLDELGEEAAGRRALRERVEARRTEKEATPAKEAAPSDVAEAPQEVAPDVVSPNRSALPKVTALLDTPVSEVAGQAKEAAGRLSRAARDKLRGALARSPEAPAHPQLRLQEGDPALQTHHRGEAIIMSPAEKEALARSAPSTGITPDVTAGEVYPRRIEELRAQLYSGEAMTISPAEKEALRAANMRDFGTPDSPRISRDEAKERLRELRAPLQEMEDPLSIGARGVAAGLGAGGVAAGLVGIEHQRRVHQHQAPVDPPKVEPAPPQVEAAPPPPVEEPKKETPKPAAKPAKKKAAAKKKPAKKAAPPAGSPPPVPQSMTDRYASK